MLRNTLIGLIAGTSLSLGGLFIDSASAQVTAGEGSDTQGTNVGDFSFAVGSTDVLQSIASQGEQLANDIELAFNEDSDIALANSQVESNAANRRCQKRMFVLDRPDPNRNRGCDRAENSEFEQLAVLERADEFLEEVDRQVEEINREIEINRLW